MWALDDITRRQRGTLRHTRAVRTHVGDEPRCAFAPEIRALVQRLRDAHGALGPEAEFLGRFLLQRAGRERRSRMAELVLAPDLADGEPLGPE